MSNGTSIFSGTFNATEKLTCDNVFERFHKCEAAFIKKALESSNPFTLCTSNDTYIPYTNMTLYFKLLSNMPDVKHYNLTCSEEFLNQNQMTVITTIVEASNRLWSTANCEDCYNGTSTKTQMYSNHTLDIFALHSNYSACTNSQKNASQICIQCETFYFDLNSRFEMEKKKRGGNICFDLEDQVSSMLVTL
jgi:Osteopetrosis-associated transmembrane protein 1 precursor